MKCVFSWQPKPLLKQFFTEQLRNKFKLVFVDKTDKTLLKSTLQDAEVLVGWVMDENMLSTAKKLTYILYPGAGVSHFSEQLIKVFKQKKLVFTNSHSNAFATAQHACAMLLTLSNQVIQHHNYLIQGKWRTGDKEAKSISLRKKKVGLLGFGAIGQQIYKMLVGFDCTFTVYKQSHNIDADFKKLIQLFSFEDDPINGLKNFLKISDVVICSLPKTQQTIHLLNKTNLKYLSSSALLVNVGRGSVIEENALFQVLKNKKIGGAAIDVWYNYTPEADKTGQKYPYNFPFHDLGNVVLSPHRGASPMDDPYRFSDLIYNLNEIMKPDPQLKNIIDFDREY